MAATEEKTLLPTLTGDYYVDDAIYGVEQERIFARQWLCTARASELELPGTFQTFDVAGESIIVVRGRTTPCARS